MRHDNNHIATTRTLAHPAPVTVDVRLVVLGLTLVLVLLGLVRVLGA